MHDRMLPGERKFTDRHTMSNIFDIKYEIIYIISHTDLV